MITVTAKTFQNEKFDCVVPSRQELFILIYAFENSKTIHQFKVSLSEGILVKDLKYQFNFGHFTKFVTEFIWV